MSAHQGISACRIQVDPSTADVLRVEAKKVLMFNHEPFEDFLDYVPAKQLALADVYRDATAVIDAIGWDPDRNPHIETRRGAADPPATSSSSIAVAATCWTPTSTCSPTSAPTGTTTPSSWPRSTQTVTASKRSTASSTPTATRSPRRPSWVMRRVGAA